MAANPLDSAIVASKCANVVAESCFLNPKESTWALSITKKLACLNLTGVRSDGGTGSEKRGILVV